MGIFNKNKGEMKENIWNEIKKINWKKVNKDSLMDFKINYIGDIESLTVFITELEKSKYDFFGVKLDKENALTAKAREKIIFIDINKIENIKIDNNNSEINIVDNKYINKVREKTKIRKYYIFNSILTEENIEEIINDHEELTPALGFNYPALRAIASRKKITEIAIQNGVWAAGSSFANIIPGPHQIVTAPLEGASDFTVLTANELRMIFITAGISGRIIEPLKLIPELVIMISGAKGAQMLATQSIGKIPVGAGNILKGAIAFAFTFAIGEAVFLNINYGIKIDSKKIAERVKVLEEFSKEKISKFIKKKKQDSEESIDVESVETEQVMNDN
ncbi:MAG: hypothetical protein FD141_732 [Fusobacteria bacterium]|nr:MAG: hypothetical protein FD141_732 [Fusobacteriota bacterium]KAF0228602.1 MAG: hypothetical protein FD182_858 [Fusobacteriota bacterium]